MTSTNATAPAKLPAGEIPWNHYRMQKKLSDHIVDVIIWLLLAAIVVIITYPIWFILIASVSDQNAVNLGKVTLLPVGFNWDGYREIFADTRIWDGYRNTIVYSVVGTALNMLVTLPAAFALSRKELGKVRRVVLFFFSLTMFVSGGMIPTYLLFKSLGLVDNWLVFILPSAVNVYNLIIARSFFETAVPEELFDSAKVDGMSYGGYFLKIVLPLSSAVIAVVALYYFVAHWNEFFTGLMYINDDSRKPLQNVLQAILLSNQTGAEGSASLDAAAQQELADKIKYGVIFVSSLPLLVIYPFLQKYFNKGVLLGAVKG